MLHDIYKKLQQFGHHFGLISVVVNNLERNYEGFFGNPNYTPKLEYSIRYHCHVALHMKRTTKLERRRMTDEYRNLHDYNSSRNNNSCFPVSIICLKSNLHPDFKAFALITKYGLLGAEIYNELLSDKNLNNGKGYQFFMNLPQAVFRLPDFVV